MPLLSLHSFSPGLEKEMRESHQDYDAMMGKLVQHYKVSLAPSEPTEIQERLNLDAFAALLLTGATARRATVSYLREHNHIAYQQLNQNNPEFTPMPLLKTIVLQQAVFELANINKAILNAQAQSGERAQILEVNQKISKEINVDSKQMQPKIYISYSWSTESETVADIIERDWGLVGLEIIRDKRVLKYKDSLREYMKSMGSGDYVILLINKEYLQSKNCMFELLELYKERDFKNKVLPIILDSAKINDDFAAADYIDYWQKKASVLSERYQRMTKLSNTLELQQKLNLYEKIASSIDEVISLLSDMLTIYWSESKSIIYEKIFKYINHIVPDDVLKSFDSPAISGMSQNFSPNSSITENETRVFIPRQNPANGNYNNLTESQRGFVHGNAARLNAKISEFSGSEQELNEIISLMEAQEYLATTFYHNVVKFVRRYQEIGTNSDIKSRLNSALQKIGRIF